MSRTNRKLPAGNGRALTPNSRWGNSDFTSDNSQLARTRQSHKMSGKVWLAFLKRIAIATGGADSAHDRRNFALKRFRPRSAHIGPP
jgi:hypothetical protein